MGPMSWLRFMFHSRLLARATSGQMQDVCVALQSGRSRIDVRARAAATDEIKLTDSLLLPLRSRGSRPRAAASASYNFALRPRARRTASTTQASFVPSLRIRAGLCVLQRRSNWVDIVLTCASASCFWHDVNGVSNLRFLIACQLTNLGLSNRRPK
jgi:hypothetical protein